MRDLVCLQLHYIISNGYTLVDADGKVTTWGRWDPVTLNMYVCVYACVLCMCVCVCYICECDTA